jgi:hypothetical protein
MTKLVLPIALAGLLSSCTVQTGAADAPAHPTDPQPVAAEAPATGTAPPAAAGATGDLTPEGKINCGGQQDLVIENKRIHLPNAAPLVVEDQCTVTVKNCELINDKTNAYGVAVKASDQATLIIESSTIQGHVVVEDQATIRISNSAIWGDKRIDDQGSLEDLGGNSWQQR